MIGGIANTDDPKAPENNVEMLLKVDNYDRI